MHHVGLIWRAILPIALLMNCDCSARRPDFMTRVREDCVAGNQWACDLLDALSHPNAAEKITAPDHVKDDVTAIWKGIDKGISATF
jgi:hypothetical protein